MEQRVTDLIASLAHRLKTADATPLVEQMLLAQELHERLAAAEKLAASAADMDERRKRLPTSLPVGGIITPV